MIDLLADLPSAMPQPLSTERVRQRCHAALRKPIRHPGPALDHLAFAASALYLVTAAIQLLVFF